MEQGKSYQFENVQFHLLQHQNEGESPVEIVAFHWHLKRANSADSDNYMHRPHLHLRTEEEPLRASHFSVTLGVPLVGEASMDYLDSLLDDAASMFAVEVLARLS